jgi:isopenicillin N synthase-like dioxygenase
MNIETLDSLGYISVAYPPLLRVRVQQAMESWKAFCSLPQEEKKKLSGGERHKDFGYMLRQDSGPRADRKELAHVKLGDFDELLLRASKLDDNRATAFIHSTELLLEAIGPFIDTFAERVEAKYGLTGFAQEVSKSRASWTFRYLHYFPTENVGKEISYAHADRGGFTFHLDESHTGAEYLGFDRKWHALPVSMGETVIFPSMGLQYRSGSKLKALCHRVRATPHAAAGGRYSMVGFIDFGTKMPVAERTQDFPPGFNYKMPAEEFEALFAPAVSQTM